MLPACYDEFKYNKLYKCISHPEIDGDRVYLTVPFTDKDKVKALGARWGRGHPVNEKNMSIGDVTYTTEQALALREWSDRWKMWWYWSNVVTRDDLSLDERLKHIQESHRKSIFSKWEVDTTAMKRAWAENESCM
jgi:hypothetical protein